MEQILGRIPAILIALFSAVAAFVLRTSQLAAAYDESGRMIVGLGDGPLTLLCLLMLAVFAVYSFFLRPRKKYQTLASASVALFAMTTVASVAMLVGCVLLALNLAQMSDLLIATGGVVAAICWFVSGLDRVRGRKTPAALFMTPALFYAVDLICEFRYWSRDPMILEYCFDLLAMICVMCATYHLGGFCFDRGSRRRTAFFSLCGIFFCAAAMADGSVSSRIRMAAAALWLFANLLPLLRRVKKQKNEEV